MSDTNINQLIINELTKAQYEALTPEANQLYIVTDEVPLDTSAITTTLSSSSTDSQVPSAKCVYDYHDSTKVTANNAITGATKCKITYDAKGLVTAGDDLASSDVTTALGYTPYNSTNPSNYQTNVLEGVKINNTDLTISDKKVNIPLASTSTLGVVKVDGTSITISNGVISSSGGGGGGLETEVW